MQKKTFITQWGQRCLILKITLCLLNVFPSLGYADVRAALNSEAPCNIFIENDIHFGDASAFRRISQALLQDPDEEILVNWPLTVCLDSAGGSYLEAINLALLVKDFYQTRLMDGAECFSACATVFLAGSADDVSRLISGNPEEAAYGQNSRPMRTLAPSSRLGFHAPYFDVGDRSNIPVSEVEEMSRALLEWSSFVQSVSTQLYPPELMREAMRRGPEDLYMVNRVGQLNAWNINLSTNYRPPFNVETFQRAWVTFQHSFANGEPGFGSVGSGAFGVMDELPVLRGTSGWDDVELSVDREGHPTLAAHSVGGEASFSALFSDHRDHFVLTTFADNRADEFLSSNEIRGWQLADPRSFIWQLEPETTSFIDSVLFEQLVQAARAGNISRVEALLRDGVHPNAHGALGFSAMHAAAEQGNVDLLSILIDHGADVNVSGRNGELPIHWAARSNSTGAIAWLIDNGVGLNAVDENGYTALHHAAQNVSLDAIDLLAQRGANLEIAAGGGNLTPLGWAISLGRHDAVEALVRAGADVGVFFSENIWGADVALRELNARHKGELAFARPSPLENCIPQSGVFTVVNVDEFVNIRAQPSLDAPVIARVDLGEPLDISLYSQVFVPNSHHRANACRLACEGANLGSQSAVEHIVHDCFESNAYWYGVRTSRGLEGFVSGRYLVQFGRF